MSKKRTNRRAFTLVELLVVLIIIGIMAGGMVLVAGRANGKAEACNIVTNLRAIKNASMMYYADNGFFPTGSGFIDLNVLSGYLSFTELQRAESEPSPGYYLYSEDVSGDRLVRVFYKNISASEPRVLFDEGVVRSLSDMAEKCGLYNNSANPAILTQSNIGTDTDRYVSMIIVNK